MFEHIWFNKSKKLNANKVLIFWKIVLVNQIFVNKFNPPNKTIKSALKIPIRHHLEKKKKIYPYLKKYLYNKKQSW